MIDDECKQIPDLPEGQMTIEPHLLVRTESNELAPVTRPARPTGAAASVRRAREIIHLNSGRPYVFYRH
jgi:hypothetical protein